MKKLLGVIFLVASYNAISASAPELNNKIQELKSLLKLKDVEKKDESGNTIKVTEVNSPSDTPELKELRDALFQFYKEINKAPQQKVQYGKPLTAVLTEFIGQYGPYLDPSTTQDPQSIIAYTQTDPAKFWLKQQVKIVVTTLADWTGKTGKFHPCTFTAQNCPMDQYSNWQK